MSDDWAQKKPRCERGLGVNLEFCEDQRVEASVALTAAGALRASVVAGGAV